MATIVSGVDYENSAAGTRGEEFDSISGGISGCLLSEHDGDNTRGANGNKGKVKNFDHELHIDCMMKQKRKRWCWWFVKKLICLTVI